MSEQENDIPTKILDRITDGRFKRPVWSLYIMSFIVYHFPSIIILFSEYENVDNKLKAMYQRATIDVPNLIIEEVPILIVPIEYIAIFFIPLVLGLGFYAFMYYVVETQITDWLLETKIKIHEKNNLITLKIENDRLEKERFESQEKNRELEATLNKVEQEMSIISAKERQMSERLEALSAKLLKHSDPNVRSLAGSVLTQTPNDEGKEISAEIGNLATKVLRNPKSSKSEKKLAGAVLTQIPPDEEGLIKMLFSAMRILEFKNSSDIGKSLANAILSQMSDNNDQ